MCKFYRAGRLARICPSLVGASIARPGGLPGRLIYRDGCGGRHICRPYGVPVLLIIIYGRGRGIPRPYRAVYFIATPQTAKSAALDGRRFL